MYDQQNPERTGPGVRCNRAELAHLLGKSLPTIDKMVRDGVPCTKAKGPQGEYTFHFGDVVQWLCDQTRAKRRKELGMSNCNCH